MERDGCVDMSISFCFIWDGHVFVFFDVMGENDEVSILWVFLSFYSKKI